MSIIKSLRLRDWPTYFGYAFFVAMMGVGYFYNLTFVQFGLLDLGTRLVGLSRSEVAFEMALLALITLSVAIVCGFTLTRTGGSERLEVKLRLALVAIVLQTVLTAIAPLVREAEWFRAWIVAASVALGIGVPATFAMTSDLIRTRHRGYVAAAVTIAAYVPAAILSSTWTIEHFTLLIIGPMLAGALALTVLASGKLDFVRHLARQHTKPEFGRGRFVRAEGARASVAARRMVMLVAFMFGIFFVDSLGFLRLAETPFLFEAAWQSPKVDSRLVVAGAHTVGALAGGVLYTTLGVRGLFIWVFGIFALVHMMYTFTVQMPAASAHLFEPLLYAVAVSLYTVVNFAVWADISTPRTIARNAGLGVALSGWTATFISTALALRMRESGVALEAHLRVVDSLAIVLFLVVLASQFFAGGRSTSTERRSP